MKVRARRVVGAQGTAVALRHAPPAGWGLRVSPVLGPRPLSPHEEHHHRGPFAVLQGRWPAHPGTPGLQAMAFEWPLP